MILCREAFRYPLRRIKADLDLPRHEQGVNARPQDLGEHDEVVKAHNCLELAG